MVNTTRLIAIAFIVFLNIDLRAADTRQNKATKCSPAFTAKSAKRTNQMLAGHPVLENALLKTPQRITNINPHDVLTRAPKKSPHTWYELDSMLVHVGHTLVRRYESVLDIVRVLESRSPQELEQLAAGEPVEFFKIMNGEEFVRYDIRGGHHRVLGIYMYLVRNNLARSIQSIQKLHPNLVEIVEEQIDAKPNAKIPLHGVLLQTFRGEVRRRDSATAPTILTRGNNYELGSRTTLKTVAALLTEASQSKRQIAFLEVGSLKDISQAEVKNRLRKLHRYAQRIGREEIVLYSHDWYTKQQLAKLIPNYKNLNLYMGDLSSEHRYMQGNKNSTFEDMMTLRLRQIYLTYNVSKVENIEF